MPAKERVKKSCFPGTAVILAGMRETHSPENAGAAGALPGNAATMRAWRARAPGDFAHMRHVCRRGHRRSQDSFARSFAGMTDEGSGFARFSRPRQRDVAGPRRKVSRSHSHFETASDGRCRRRLSALARPFIRHLNALGHARQPIPRPTVNNPGEVHNPARPGRRDTRRRGFRGSGKCGSPGPRAKIPSRGGGESCA